MENMANGKFINGSGGNVWFDGELLANVKKCEAKVTGKFEEVELAGDFRTYGQYTGYSIEGTLTLQKVDSTILKKLKQAYKWGNIPQITIVTKVSTPDGSKAERTSIEGVQVTEFMLANFESKALVEESIPFTASSYNVLEEI